MPREDLVDLGQHARHVLVDVQQAQAVGVLGQGYFREVDRRQGAAVVAVAHQLGGHFDADVVLRFQRAAAHVRGQDHVVVAGQRRFEDIAVALRLDREHVQRRATDVAAGQRSIQRIDVDHGTARSIDQVRARAHLRQLGAADHPLCGRRLWHVQGDDVGARKQVIQAGRGTSIAQRQLGFHVVEDHLHAQRFGQYAHLGADMPVADDAQHLAAHLMAAAGRLRPAAAMAFGVLLRDATGQHDRFGDHQLGDAAGIGVGRVEYRNAGQLGRIQIDLVGADAEAADRNQALGLGQHLGAELGARTDADDVRFGDPRLQFVLGQRLGVRLDLAVAGGAEHLHGGLADPLQQQYADILLRERGLLRRHGAARPVGQGLTTMPDRNAHGAVRNWLQLQLLMALQGWTLGPATGTLARSSRPALDRHDRFPHRLVAAGLSRPEAEDRPCRP
ncbi:hypothetical protein D3C81_1070080 [compost metagenome]